MASTEERLAFLDRLLKAVAFDYCDSIWWRTFSEGEGGYHDTDLHFFVNCNDIFAWACSDCEEVTPENIHVLEAAIQDCEAAFDGMSVHRGGGTVDHLIHGPTLFVARVRKMRPQGAVMKDFQNPKVRALFDACGEKREAGTLGNPYAHPDDGGRYEYRLAARAQLEADAAQILSPERSTSDRPRDITSSSSRPSDMAAASRDEIDPAGVPRKDT